MSDDRMPPWVWLSRAELRASRALRLLHESPTQSTLERAQDAVHELYEELRLILVALGRDNLLRPTPSECVLDVVARAREAETLRTELGGLREQVASPHGAEAAPSDVRRTGT